MKKVFTLLSVALMACIAVHAAPLTPDEALRRASNSPTIKRQKGVQTTGLRLAMTGTTPKGEAAYYVFTNPHCSLFLSADDIAMPILGYTESPDFNSTAMPPALKWWLEGYARELEWAKANSNGITHLIRKAKDAGNSSPKAALKEIRPLLSTTWNQGWPYNKYCPVYEGELTVTGCAATSMAQVMNYFQWPKTEVDPISYEWNETQLTSPAVKLDWANMADSYHGDYSEAQSDAVARLMQVAGYSLEMIYNTAENGGSSSYNGYIRNALINRFGYDKGLSYVMRDLYSYEEWKWMIYDNLLNVGPLVYGGQGELGGHSFVCDGFDGEDFFHINWGWGGYADGYFTLSALDPDELGIGGGGGGYNYSQDALLGIRRPKADSTLQQPYIYCLGEPIAEISGRTLTVRGADDRYYCNGGSEDVEVTIGICLRNPATGYCEYFEAEQGMLPPLYGFVYYDLELPYDIPNGVYDVYPVYKLGEGDWEYVRFPVDTRSYFRISVSYIGISIEEIEECKLTALSWDSETGFVAGRQYRGNVTLSSTYPSTEDFTLEAFLFAERGETVELIDRLGQRTVTIAGFGSATVEFDGMLGAYAPGCYLLAFFSGGEIIGLFEVNVSDEGEINLISWDSTTLVAGSSFSGKLFIESSYATPHEYTLDAHLCYREDDTYYVLQSLGSSTVTVDGNSSAEMEFSGILDELEAGEYYIVFAIGSEAVGVTEVYVYSSDPSGISAAGADADDSFPRYFNLQGEEVTGSKLTPGIYIRIKGNRSSKVMIK